MAVRPVRPKQGLSTSKLDRRVSDQKAAKELAIIIRQLWVDTRNSIFPIAVTDLYPAIKAWPASRMRTMTRSDLIATIAFGFPNLMAKDAEIAVPVSEKPVPHFKPGK
jgi:hypothetical protein